MQYVAREHPLDDLETFIDFLIGVAFVFVTILVIATLYAPPMEREDWEEIVA